MTLTKLQNTVIYCLQNGFSLVTNSDMRGANVASLKGHFHITGRAFWNLHDKGLIFQNSDEHFQYTLTKAGQEFKAKPIDINKLKLINAKLT